MGRHVKDQLDDYLMELLDPEARGDFERHVGNCYSCQRVLREAQSARAYLGWLLPAEGPPEPGPSFYSRVEASIEKKRSGGWFGNLAAAPHPRPAYLLLLLGLLLLAWTLTHQRRGNEEGLLAMELPSTQFANLSFSDSDGEFNRDVVMMSLMAEGE